MRQGPEALTPRGRRRRSRFRFFWRVANPVALRGGRLTPWWVMLETTGRKSGLPRQFPLAAGVVARFSLYARSGLRFAGLGDPVLVRVDLD